MTHPDAELPPDNGMDLILEALGQAERGPTAAELAAAPMLLQWQPIIGIDGYIVLGGGASGHPTLGSDYITTSPVLGLADDLIWCRTLSRFYRLQDPLDVALTLTENAGDHLSQDLYHARGHDLTSDLIGKPAPLTRRWILVVKPPRARPKPCRGVPLLRPLPDDGANHCAIDHLERVMIRGFAAIRGANCQDEALVKRPFLVRHQVSCQAGLHRRYRLES